MLGGRDLAGRALEQRGKVFAGDSTDLDAKALSLPIELRPVGETPSCVKESQQAGRCD